MSQCKLDLENHLTLEFQYVHQLFLFHLLQPQKEASVANPSGGNKEYFIGLQYGLLTSSSAGKINLIFTFITPYTNLFITILGCKNYFLIF